MLFLRWLNFKLGVKIVLLLMMLAAAIVLAGVRMRLAANAFVERQSQGVKQLNHDAQAARSHRW